MDAPQVDQGYLLVRVNDGAIEVMSYKRFDDGSAIALARDSCTVAECDPLAWRSLWTRLISDGFVEVDKAQKTGILPPEWKPPESTLLPP